MTQRYTPPPAALLARFDLIIAILLDMLGQGGRAGVPHPRILLIWQRITRLAARFTRAALKGPTRPRPRAPKPASQRTRPEPAACTLPRGFAWLCRLLPGPSRAPSPITYPAQQLSDLLADPAMAHLIDSNPAIGRTLRPLFTMLGIKRPKILAIPPKTPPDPGPAPPEPSPTASPSPSPSPARIDAREQRTAPPPASLKPPNDSAAASHLFYYDIRTKKL